ncbi:hypothetical protein [Actinomadura sp. HBU206391]|uniref:MmyB family transcriptional regulator n=1 Tax=Actinomadura sp. HBU206391 TaxID=2731692 RepID=UPI001C9C0B21|nr:hypothetical protein [Actinomadura sp. HBU206391]
MIEALGRVLKLDPDALEHLRDLARGRPRRRRAAHATERVRPNLLRLMEAWHHVPALVLGRHLDSLAANPLGTALMGQRPLNLVRLVFLDPAARAFYPEWERVSKDTASPRGAVHPAPAAVTGASAARSSIGPAGRPAHRPRAMVGVTMWATADIDRCHGPPGPGTPIMSGWVRPNG